MIPTIVEIPLSFIGRSIPIHSFGLLMVLCFLGALQRLQLCLKENGEDPALAEQMITWAAVGGIVGARLFYLVAFPTALASDPIGTIFGGAGFVFYGGFIGGVVAVYLLLRKVGKDFWPMSDIVAPALAVGYGIGRLGCQLSGDGDYGAPSELPWAMSYYLGVVPTPKALLVHPTPLYESAMAFATAWLLLWLRRNAILPGVGRVFGAYLLLSAAARFLVEFIRIEPTLLGSLTQAQCIAIVLSAIAMYLLRPESPKA